MNALETLLAGLPGGFITAEQLPGLVALDRLHPLLVRCGCCRFTCAAQDVAHLLKCIAAGGDYVRDVSLTAGSGERARGWIDPESMKVAPDGGAGAYRDAWTREASARPAKQRPGAWALNRSTPGGDAGEYGGVLGADGQVYSDADPGL